MERLKKDIKDRVGKMIKRCEYEIISHPHYSLDLAPFDYYLFPTVGAYFEGKDNGKYIEK